MKFLSYAKTVAQKKADDLNETIYIIQRENGFCTLATESTTEQLYADLVPLGYVDPTTESEVQSQNNSLPAMAS